MPLCNLALDIFVNIPFVIVSFWLVFKYVSNQDDSKDNKIDMVGALLLTLTLGSLILGFNQIVPHALFHQDVIYFFGVFFLLSMIFYFYEKKIRDPVFPVELTHNKTYLMGCFLRLLTSMPLYILLMVLGIYSHKNLHLNPMQSSLLFLLMTFTIGLLSPLGGKINDYWGVVLL